MAEESPVAGVKRRKVRKGTQSCWECKRRKVRCIFSASSDSICDNCQRRKTSCISQEVSYESMPSSQDEQVEKRLGRVEELIKQLVERTEPHHSRECSVGHDTEISFSPAANEDGEAALLEQSSPVDTALTQSSPIEQAPIHSQPQTRYPISVPEKELTSGTSTADQYREIIDDLMVAWPSDSDLDSICRLPVGVSMHFQIKLFLDRSPPSTSESQSARDLLTLPPASSHPILFARRLLMLGTFIQGIPPASIKELGDRGRSYLDIMCRVMDRATKLVTTNDNLIKSVEAIQCILVEAMYYNYSGQLHRSWMAVRRGIMVAQLMGLHRSSKSPLLTFLEPETRASFNAEKVCFQLAGMDYYLSLMLGLPHSSLEARLATPDHISEGDNPFVKLQRTHCYITARILQRRDSDRNNLAETRDIDCILQSAAKQLPPEWWLVPDLSRTDMDAADVHRETSRIMEHFTYYHLLTSVHLPFMLRPSYDHQFDYSKLTAVNASRELLTRYSAFRTWNTAHYYCRGADFFAFVAITVLCLAHISACCRLQDTLSEDWNNGAVDTFLTQNRHSNRGLMERTLNLMDSMVSVTTDPIATKLGRLIRYLLDAEASAASGTKYTTSTAETSEEQLEYDGNISRNERILRIDVPYFGTIKFERGIVSKTPFGTQSASNQSDPATTTMNHLSSDMIPDPTTGYPLGPNTEYHSFQHPDQMLDFSSTSGTTSFDPAFETDASYIGYDWDLQGIDTALFDSFFESTI